MAEPRGARVTSCSNGSGNGIDRINAGRWSIHCGHEAPGRGLGARLSQPAPGRPPFPVYREALGGACRAGAQASTWIHRRSAGYPPVVDRVIERGLCTAGLCGLCARRPVDGVTVRPCSAPDNRRTDRSRRSGRHRGSFYSAAVSAAANGALALRQPPVPAVGLRLRGGTGAAHRDGSVVSRFGGVQRFSRRDGIVPRRASCRRRDSGCPHECRGTLAHSTSTSGARAPLTSMWLSGG